MRGPSWLADGEQPFDTHYNQCRAAGSVRRKEGLLLVLRHHHHHLQEGQVAGSKNNSATVVDKKARATPRNTAWCSHPPDSTPVWWLTSALGP